MKNFKGAILLIITAIIWGTSFVSQKLGMNYVEPLTFGASRFLLGAVVLIPVILISDRITKRKVEKSDESREITYNKDLIAGGTLCGASLFLGAWFQQWGIVYTTAGKAGFITALYIVLVPVLGLFLHKKVSKLVWLGVTISTVGLYLLCVKEGFIIQKGDAIVLAGTIFWAMQILVVDAYVSKTDGLRLSFIQFLTAGIFSAIAALIFENPKFETIIACAGPLLYTSIMVVGVAYTLQIIGQKSTEPAIAAIIMSMESLFAVISGVIFLGETMTMKEVIGCALMLVAVLITQVKSEGSAEYTNPQNNRKTI
jgi:drug/metabolite transporter (DMT)-like permease